MVDVEASPSSVMINRTKKLKGGVGHGGREVCVGVERLVDARSFGK